MAVYLGGAESLCPQRCGSAFFLARRRFSSCEKVAAHIGSRKQFLPFEQAKEYLRTCGVPFTRQMDYRNWRSSGKRPPFIPSRPEIIYASCGWAGYRDYLGYERRKNSPGVHPDFEDEVEQVMSGSTPRRDAMSRRHRAMNHFMERLRHDAPDFEVRRFSPRWPSILLVRRDREGVDWMAVQVKFSSSSSEFFLSRGGRSVFHNVARRQDVGVVFLCEDAASIAYRMSTEIGVRSIAIGKYSTVSLRLEAYRSEALLCTMNQWWDRCRRRSLEEWCTSFGYGHNHTLDQHDVATNEVAKMLFEPAGVNVEKIFPLDTNMQGNVLLSGIRCFQRIARSRVRQVGYNFDMNKASYSGVQRRGNGWKGAVQRYVCIIMNGYDDVKASLRGVYIMPHEFVFRSRDGKCASRRGRLILYPPCCSPRNVNSRSKQAEQNKFFIDFANTQSDERTLRARKLLGLN